MENSVPQQILVNGQPVSLEELAKLKEDPKKRLVETAPNSYKLLEKMYG
jgi:hypothetical protein